jgi:hypothetical protein
MLAAMGFQTITHRERVRSCADCVKLMRVLGGREVLVNGWQTDEPRAIEQLVTALVAAPESFGSGSTIAFHDGRFDDTVWAVLGELAASRCDHVSVETPSAILKIWPPLANPGPHVPAWGFPAKISAAARVDKLVRGTKAVASSGRSRQYPFLISTADIPLACMMFRRLAGPTFTSGSVVVHVDPAPTALAPFIIAAHARMSAQLVLTLDVAEKLAATIGGDALDWQGGGIHVRFPTGEITSILGNDQPRERWGEREARVTDAFKRAKLRT